ncbi:non-ribosomal peptide synthetase/type I polyketide synthase [Parachitinimonas caeni]|uniref:Amino acid adenylation domain-containing protein n=1 Tax=Parachitinimonas caeni TaxID=3031301 RepID=A0ABT7DWG7_9NEIS|nr:non-ribosomal peptide synthetase/type I polyketide synthase [Parachitinimonas caeni]MDK2124395.1 amino acid adenylation domain-containing protein [Parachitinimonas caeni]
MASTEPAPSASPQILTAAWSLDSSKGGGRYRNNSNKEIRLRDVAFIYSGVGAHWPGMAQQLADQDPAARRSFETISAAWSRVSSLPLLDLLLGGGPAADADTDVSYPAIFALQLVLTEVLARRGIRPALVLGHSAGEVAAAVTAGALSLEAALPLVAAHCSLMRATPAGSMLHVALSADQITARLQVCPGLELAAINADDAVIVAGSAVALAPFAAQLQAEGVFCRELKVSLPFHTSAVEAGLAAFRQQIAGLQAHRADIPYISSCTGTLLPGSALDADYWARQIRQPIRFVEAVECLIAQQPAAAIEIGPHPSLLQHLDKLCSRRSRTFPLLPSLHRDAHCSLLDDSVATLLDGAAPSPAGQPGPSALLAALTHALSEVLAQPVDLADKLDERWSELGLNSAQSVTLLKALSQQLGRKLPATLAYRCPTPALLLAELTASPAPQPTPVRPADDSPVGIVGMACRFPGGANSPSEYWDLLISGRDPISEIPADRWNASRWYHPDRTAPGKSVSRWGGFIAGQDLHEFDARLFRLMPKEASALDPQQRLLLEVTWEALENAGIPPLSLKGQRVAVYAGLSTDDYKAATLYTDDLDSLDPYAAAGAMNCTAAGRLSYFFGWQGPNMAIDTACSSSVVALHLACQALKSGDCDLAVVAGVNALLTPHLYVYFSKAGILSPTGRCHTFSDAADGYVRSEGCGVLILERETDARRHTRRIRARVAATALNQDGASSGFSAPNGSAQTQVIQQAWAQAGVSADAIDYVEAHGTGTQIGDPIELEALTAAVGEGRQPQSPLLIGSVKSQIGHLEAAAGMASLIKLVLAMEAGQIPASLHADTLSNKVDWSSLPLAVVRSPRSWPARNGRRVAGVSSFGFSGTNSHAVLVAETANDTRQPLPVHRPLVLSLSAATPAALQAMAQRYATALGGLSHDEAADLACSSHLGRQAFSERLAVWGQDAATLAQQLLAEGASQRRSGQGNAGPLAFLFTGQGSQYPGMAAELYQHEPVFRDLLDDAEARLRAEGHAGILSLLIDPSADAAVLAQTRHAQLGLFILQCGLAALWRSWGQEPAYVVGHSIGEFAAAVVAGVLTFADALQLVLARGQLMDAQRHDGAMAALPLDESTALAAIAPFGSRLAIAALNGPQRTVVSGDADALDQLLAQLGPIGRQARRLQVSHAFHSSHMQGAVAPFAARCAEVRLHAAQIHWISTQDGEDYYGRVPAPDYFARQIIAPVRFDAALRAVEAADCRSLVEIGPAAVLTALGSERAGADQRCWLPSLRRNKPARDCLAEAVASLAAQGHTIAWTGWYGAGRRQVDVPGYPFQRKRYWREPVMPMPIAAGNVPADTQGTPISAAYLLLDAYAEYGFLDMLRQHFGVLRTPGQADARITLNAQIDGSRRAILDSGLAVLARAGLIQQDEQWLVLLQDTQLDIDRKRAQILARHPSMAGTLALIDACLASYPAVLRGSQHPTEVLFPGGDLSRVAACYADNEVQDSYNRLVAEAVAGWLAQQPAGAAPQLLEVGTGTGSTTAAILKVLPANWPGRYLCTDVSRGFFAQARRRLGSDRLDMAVLDLEKPALAQGFAPASVDLVIANNVLHATADIARTLANLRPLLRPGGCLLVHEQVVSHGFIHLTFGLADGWHRATDKALRLPDSPLLDLPHWRQLLQQAGFEPGPAQHGDSDASQFILLARHDGQADLAQPAASLPAAPLPISPLSARTPAMSTHISALTSLPIVIHLIAQLTGLDNDEVNPDHSLLELGLDSLMMVQLGTQLEKQHGLQATLAEFYDDLDTARKIAGRLADCQPAPVAAAPVVAAAPQNLVATPVSMPAPVAAPAAVLPSSPIAPAQPRPALQADGSLHSLMSQQLDALSRLMQDQLTLLGQAGPTNPVPAPALVPSPLPSATPAAEAPGKAEKPAAPNFRSLKLDEDVLDARQQAFLEALTQRYTQRTGGSRQLAADHRKTLCDWKNTLSFRYTLKEMMYPIASDQTVGSHMIDVDGNDYVDITMGCGVGLLGHAEPAVVAAVQAQAAHSFAIGPQNPLAAEVAAQISRLTGMERVTFCNTGAEAVMMAVRLARAVTGRRKIVIFSGAYHGTWDGVLGMEHDGHVFPTGAGIPPGMVEDLLIVNYGTEEGLDKIRAHAHELAAVLVEPVQSRRPGFHPVAFLKTLREITRQHDVALIFDEMITGFRIAAGGAQQAFGIRADMAVYGKIVGGGLPMSIVSGSARYLDAVDGGDWRYGDASRPEHEVIYFGGTYVKHPIALAAARAALQIIETTPDLYTRLNQKAARMAERLNAFFAAESVPIQLNHFGSLFRFDGTGRFTALFQPIEMDLFGLLLNLHGVYIWERRICFLSTAHTDADIERIISAVKQAVSELRAGGFAFRSPEGPHGGKSLPSPVSRPTEGAVTAAQQRLFALTAIEGANTAYNVPLSIALRGALRSEALDAALQQVFQRHEALRTRFVLAEEGVRQQVVANARFVLQRETATPATLEQQVKAFIRPFELTEAPLFRAALFTLAADHHVLVMDAHHIVVDGLSLNLIASELMALYEGKTLPAVPAQPLDQVASAQQWQHSLAHAEASRYWQQQFASLPEPLALPTDFPRPARRSQRGDDRFAELDATATRRLKEAALRHKLPLFPLLLAGWSLLLQRLAGQDEVVVGVPVGGRSDERFAGTVGMFAQTLPLRLAGNDLTVAEAARQCHRSFLQAMSHQDYPLDEILRGLNVERDLSRNPLFDVMFIMENGNDRVYKLAGLQCETLTISRGAAMFDLSMEVVEAEGRLQLRCEYATDLFSADSAQEHLDRYLALLQSLPEQLEQPAISLNLQSETEAALLREWGRGEEWTEVPTLALTGFLEQASRQPDAIALSQGEVQFSYGELLRRANQLAHTLLRRQPLQANDRVALICERTPDMLIGLLAILQTGAAYVPIDPDFPAERIQLMLDESRARLILGSHSALGRLALPTDVVTQPVDQIDPTAPQTAPAIRTTPDDLAYVIFTSGSTGKPKGVMVRQRNAAAFFSQLAHSFGLSAGDRLLAVTTISFDIASLELIGSLWHGLTLVLATTAQARDPEALLTLIQQEDINTLQLTPTRLAPLLALDASGTVERLKTLLVGGEALPAPLAERLQTLPGQCFSVYGPTETTIWSAALPLNDGQTGLGRALPGQQLFVLDKTGQLQIMGATGEIAIAGVGVAAGYLDQADATDARFIRNPQLAEGRIYLTGDLGRWTRDGTLQFLGRSDGQVKVRGVRIELAEIEQQLKRHAALADAAVILRRDGEGEAQLLAYLVCRESMPAAAWDEGEWRNWLAEHLPDAMVPSRFVQLASLPQTPNGKLDRRALPEPPARLRAGQSAQRQPANAAEQAVLAALREVLQVEAQLGDSYFSLGGDSIRALKLIARLRAAGFDLTMDALFAHPQAEAIARHLTPRKASSPHSTAQVTGLDEDELADLFK